MTERTGLASRMALGLFWGLLLSVQAQTRAPGVKSFETLLKEGFALHQAAKYPEAISALERARRIAPQDYFANLLLGIDLLRSGKPSEAVPRLRLAAQVNPSEGFPLDYLAEAEQALGNHAQAAEAHLDALKRGHNSEQGLEAWAGFSLDRFRDIGEGLRTSQAGLEIARRLQSADISAKAGAACPAQIPGLERRMAIKNPPLPVRFDGDAAYRLSVCYAVEAGKASDQLQNGAQDLAAVYQLRGDALLRLKADGAAAEAEYRRAIAIRSNDPALLERLAEAQLAAGEIEPARESARSALAVDPHRIRALRTLAALAMNNHEYADAIPILRQITAEAPGDLSAEVELARALAQIGQTAEALKWLAPALTSGFPDEKGASHALLAKLLQKSGRAAEAAKAEAEAKRLSDAYQLHDHSDEGDAATVNKVPSAVH